MVNRWMDVLNVMDEWMDGQMDVLTQSFQQYEGMHSNHLCCIMMKYDDAAGDEV